MKRSEMLSISLIALVLISSFFAVTFSQANIVSRANVSGFEDAKPVILSLPLMIGVGLHEDSHLLNQSTRMEIYTFVKNNPGTHFRDLCNSLGLSIGVVQYHLDLLVKAGLVSVYHDRRFRRYFESKKFDKAEMKTISLLRHETAGRILAILAERDSIFHKELASKLGISSQALIWQVNGLRKTGLIEAVKEGMKVKYLLSQGNVEIVKRCLGLLGRPSS